MAGINIGDEVRFINEPLQGIVTALRVNGLAGVTIEDGFEIDVPLTDLVVITRSAAPAASSPTAAPAAKAPSPEYMPKTREGLYWQVTETDMGFRVQCWNNLTESALFAAYRQGVYGTELLASGTARSGEVIALATIKGKERTRRGVFHITLLPLRNMPANIPAPVTAELDLTVFNATDPDFLTHDARHWLFRIEAGKKQETTPEPVVQPSSRPAMNVSRPAEIVDLHAGKLNLTGLEGDAILKGQMEEFHKQLELAIAWQLPQIIFIHGSGSGVLKNLIRLALKGHSSVRSYTDADAYKFGEGAIQIFLK